ncbi:MAG TPA: flavin monoamine oxidase family protein [Stellaceae bacterium]|nr:flavin monoamine oxidase family protein [Stellaceae bacterium]
MTGTRRDFLRRVGALGGFRATYLTMQAMGLLSAGAKTASAAPGLQPGHHTRVVILGAGLAGLSAAYELRKAGYDCTILEARSRVGGRNWTIRRDTVIGMTDGTHQRCAFDEGQYWNAGPARIPSHHQALLGYCRELGVALEVEVNTSRGEMLLNSAANDGKPVELRRAVNDSRGEISELLAKAVNRGALDQELTAHDKERMLAFLRQYGDLDVDLLYKGSSRAGYTTLPGAADQSGTIRPPLPLDRLLDEDMWSGMLFEDAFDFQATMFQPVGGMDHIPAAFAKQLGAVVRLGCEVTAIRRTDNGVRVNFWNTAARRREAIAADYCLVTIPLKVLKAIEADFSPDYAAAIGSVDYGNAVKIAWQAPRFWEAENHIYGGISWVKAPTALVWYPSDHFFSSKAILLGAYSTARDDVDALAAMPLAEQFALSRAAIEGLHPGHGKDLSAPMAIAWSNVPYTYGIAARWPSDNDPRYALLNTPDGPFYFAGEHLSHVGAWQEGAILSAWRAIGLLDRHRRAKTA